MAKTGPKKTRRGGESSKLVAGCTVLGTTKDGVRILKPKGGATHFSQKELLGAVASARITNKAR
jgi:hypothetical protein